MAQTRPRYDRATALDAALDLFWRQGFHATSLKDIEAALAMKPGSIYAAFTSKEALFREVLHRYFEAERNRLRALADRGGSPLEGLVAHLRGAGQEPGSGRACMLVKTVLELSGGDDRSGEEARAYLDALRGEIRELFRAAAARGELARDDPDRLARLYQSKLIALKIEAQRGTDEAALKALAEDMAGEIADLRAA